MYQLKWAFSLGDLAIDLPAEMRKSAKDVDQMKTELQDLTAKLQVDSRFPYELTKSSLAGASLVHTQQNMKARQGNREHRVCGLATNSDLV